MKVGVTAVMIAHNEEERSLTRFLRDLLPSLWLLRPVLDAEIVVIDNSEVRSDRFANAVLDNGGFTASYCWNEGRNLMYGPSLNVATGIATRPFLLYVCSTHGHMYDPTWAWDLLTTLVDDPRGDIAMCGTLAASGPPGAMGFPESLSPVHVQGGLFGARTDVLRAHLYAEGDYAHWGSDVYQSFQLMAAGYRLVNVPSIRSVWRSAIEGRHWKYVHQGG
jgi:hypothetical protein